MSTNPPVVKNIGKCNRQIHTPAKHIPLINFDASAFKNFCTMKVVLQQNNTTALFTFCVKITVLDHFSKKVAALHCHNVITKR